MDDPQPLFPADTTLFLVDLSLCPKRHALEQIVSGVFGKDPGKLHLPKYRRPTHPDFFLSTSHRHPLAVFAISKAPVGVDIEPATADEDDPDLAPYLTTNEIDRSRLEFWTRKEACLKAAGLGLALHPGLVDTSGDTVPLCRLSLRLLTLRTGHHIVSVAHCCPGPVHFYPKCFGFLRDFF